MSTDLTTTAADVLATFNVTPTARDTYEKWASGPRRDTVVPHVLAHRTRVLYQVTPEDIKRIQGLRDPKQHALDEIKREEGERIDSIVNWEPAYAFAHVFHYALEKLGYAPTWLTFCHFCYDDSKCRQMLWEPAQDFRRKLGWEHGWSKEQTYKAMRWRIGNYYYSFLREIHLIAELRRLGPDVRFHPLADALFRVDAWCDRTALSLYIRNPKYKEGKTMGRKKRTHMILSGANPEFSFGEIELPPADKFGIVHLASIDDIRTALNDLRKAGVHLKEQ